MHLTEDALTASPVGWFRNWSRAPCLPTVSRGFPRDRPLYSGSSYCGQSASGRPGYSVVLGNGVEETVRDPVLVSEPKVRRIGFFSPNEPYRSGLDWVVHRREPKLLHEAAAQPGVSLLSPGAPGRRELEVRIAPEASALSPEPLARPETGNQCMCPADPGTGWDVK